MTAASCSRSSACTRVRALRPAAVAHAGRGGPRDRATCSASRARTACCFPPDPGAAEQSQIGGNIATNAGGPHALQVRRHRRVGDGPRGGRRARRGRAASAAPLRKDVAGYDLRGLLIGSEGTLGIVTAAWLRLIPAPEAALPVVALLPRRRRPAAPRSSALTAAASPAALEYLDAGALAAAAGLPVGGVPGADAGFAVLAEADGPPRGARPDRDDARRGARATARSAVARARRPRRCGAGATASRIAVTAQRGGKLSRGHRRAGRAPRARRSGRRSRSARATASRRCTWGHAGDGNLHCDFLLDAGRRRRARARDAPQPRSSSTLAARARRHARRASTGSAG